MREKSPRSNLQRRLLILRKKLERTASFPKKLFLGFSPSRLIFPPNPLRAAPAGAASKPLLPPTKNHEVQFGADERTRTSNPCGIRTSSVRVYQFRHVRAVPKRGFEPPRANAHSALNAARLPVPPLRRLKLILAQKQLIG